MRLPTFIAAFTICLTLSIMADEPVGRTSFQEASGWSSVLDFQQDTTIVYGVSNDLRSRIASWRNHGYRVEFMTGVAWGNYNDFQSGQWDGVEYRDTAQRRRNGS